jgi:hypothetical protein
VLSLAAALASGGTTFNGMSNNTLTDLDNSTPPYTDALAVLGIPDTFAAAPTAGATIDLYATLEDIDGTSDETPVPASADILYLARYMGSFVVDNQDVALIKPINISLLGIRKAKFHIINNSGQTISYSSNPTTVKITPFSVGVTV